MGLLRPTRGECSLPQSRSAGLSPATKACGEITRPCMPASRSNSLSPVTSCRSALAASSPTTTGRLDQAQAGQQASAPAPARTRAGQGRSGWPQPLQASARGACAGSAARAPRDIQPAGPRIRWAEISRPRSARDKRCERDQALALSLADGAVHFSITSSSR